VNNENSLAEDGLVDHHRQDETKVSLVVNMGRP
jgi:hypothetical protein